MIIAIEGPDCSGKSYLAQYLKERTGAEYIHLTYRFSKQMFTYHWAALEKAIRLSQQGKLVILDRFWPSINIYDDTFRKRRDFPMAGRMLDRAGLTQGVFYVVCLPENLPQLERDFEARRQAGGEMYDRVRGAWYKYHEWYCNEMRDREDVILYDRFTDGQNLDRFAAKISQRALTFFSKVPHWMYSSRLFAGNATKKPKAFIIGEKSNPKGRHEVWPFFEHANSSLWVTDTIARSGISEYDLIWANAIDSEGWGHPTDIAQIAELTEVPKIIALGKKAKSICHFAGVGQKTIELPHPAYVKRFQHGNPDEYLAVFKEIE